MYSLPEKYNKTKLSVAFQGELGAYSNQASIELFARCGKEITPYPCRSFAQAFDMLEEKIVDFAVLPIENSTAGRIGDVMELLNHHNHVIIGEYFLPIKHQLVGHKNTSFEDITEVLSHYQALSQAKHYLNRNGFKPIIMNDTAGAARTVAENKNNHQAALASKVAAQIHGLKIIKQDVVDKNDNITRFLVLNKLDENENTSTYYCSEEEETITTFIFSVRNIPAALYKALGGFATNNVNMVKLESFLLNRNFTSSLFYSEVLAHPKQAKLQRAFEELTFFSSAKINILGAYRSDNLRNNSFQ